MSSNCPDCGALLTGDVCLSCGYRPRPGAGRSGAEGAPDSPPAAGHRPGRDPDPERQPGPERQRDSERRRDPEHPRDPERRPESQTSSEGESPAVTGEPPAWERRPPLGFFRALWTTWRESVFRPVQFFRSLRPDGPVGPALAYYTLFLAVGTFFTLYWSTLEAILGGGPSALSISEWGIQLSPGQEVTLLIAGAFIYFVFAVVFFVVALFLTVAIVHVGFLVVGAGRQGFSATFRGLAYAGGPLAFALFPFFGGLISLVWLTVLAFIAMREVQRTTNLRAAMGFLVPILVLPMLMFIFFFIIGLILSTADVAPVA